MRPGANAASSSARVPDSRVHISSPGLHSSVRTELTVPLHCMPGRLACTFDPLTRSRPRKSRGHGFDGDVSTDVAALDDAVSKVVLREAPSLVIVDDPGYGGEHGSEAVQ